MKFTKIVLVPVIAAALLTSGCSISDRVAAEIGSANVSTADVEVLSEMQCALVQANPAQQGAPTVRVLRNAALDALVHMEVVAQIIDEREAGDYDVDAFRQQTEGIEEALQAVPRAQRDRAIELLKDYTRRELQLQHVATEALADQGNTSPTPEQVQQMAAQIYNEFRRSIDIEVSPEFSADDTGQAGREDGSLSVPVSDYAKQATAEQPDPSWVASLPARLRCT